MRKVVIAAIAGSLCILMAACQSSANAPIKVSLVNDDIVVQSLVDNITINKAEVNRGNCKSFNPDGEFNALMKSVKNGNTTPDIEAFAKYYPQQLKFGDTEKISTLGNCDITEVDVDTDRGTYRFDFK